MQTKAAKSLKVGIDWTFYYIFSHTPAFCLSSFVIPESVLDCSFPKTYCQVV
jgi:hypothetical protein